MIVIVCNIKQKEYFSQVLFGENSHFITSENEFIEFENADAGDIDFAVIVAELDWDSKKLTNFYGFEIATLLRLKFKVLLPLVLVSFCSQEYFALQKNFKYNILNVRGTAFVQLPFLKEQIEQVVNEVRPLTNATLKYISTLLVDIRYLVDVASHDLRIEKDNATVADALKKIVQQLEPTKIFSKIKKISDNVAVAHQQRDENTFYALKKDLIYHLNIYLQQDSNGEFNTASECKHKVLLLDDNPNDLAWATRALSPHFEIAATQSAHEAIELIDNDTSNDFAAIICDWQLVSANGQHQELLGFEILEYASRKGFYALFSLTSTDDLSIREVDMELEFEHQLFIKDFQQGDILWKSYIPIIQQKIDKNVAVIASQPMGTAWMNNFKLDYRKNSDGTKTTYKRKFPSFKEQYLKKRNSHDWYRFKNEIDEEATKCWNYYEEALQWDKRPSVGGLNDKWGVELNREITNFLLIRRLFFAFWFNKMQLDITFKVLGEIIEEPIVNIYCVLRSEYLDPDARYLSKDEYGKLLNRAKVFANQLSIETSRLPYGLLPEEKSWLKRFGIDINSGNDILIEGFEDE